MWLVRLPSRTKAAPARVGSSGHAITLPMPTELPLSCLWFCLALAACSPRFATCLLFLDRFLFDFKPPVRLLHSRLALPTWLRQCFHLGACVGMTSVATESPWLSANTWSMRHRDCGSARSWRGRAWPCPCRHHNQLSIGLDNGAPLAPARCAGFGRYYTFAGASLRRILCQRRALWRTRSR